MAFGQVTARHWLVLFLACAVTFSNYYCYDIPSALNVPLRKWLKAPYAEYQWQLNLLYSVYSLPNVLLPLFGGLLVDALSPNVMLMIFVTLVAVGQGLFASGVAAGNFNLMVIGRVVFGAGGESLEVAASRIATDWFQGRGLGFAMSVHLSMARIATAANANLSPWLANEASTPFAVWFGLLVCLASFLCAVAMLYVDRPASRVAAGIATSNQKPRKRTEGGSADRLNTDSAVNSPRIRGKSVDGNRSDDGGRRSSSSSRSFISTSARSPSVGRSPTGGKSTRSPSGSRSISGSPIRSVARQHRSFGTMDDRDSNSSGLDESDDVEEEYDEEDETVHFSQLRGLRAPFWMLCLTAIAFYGSAIPFFHICTDFFQQKWYKDDSQMAGTVMSITDIVSAVGSPICGLFIDRFGHRSTMLPLAGILVLISHLLFGWTTITPIVGMVILGLAYSIFAASVWTCVPYVVGNHQIATAYGLVTVALNMSLATFPLAVAQIRNSYPDSFIPVQIFFVGLSLVSIATSSVLFMVDARNGWVLLKSHRPQPHYERVRTSSDSPRDDQPGTVYTPLRHFSDPAPSYSRDEFDESDFTTRVVGDGVIVPTPHTHIHHRHYHRHTEGEACTCAEDNGRPRSADCITGRSAPDGSGWRGWLRGGGGGGSDTREQRWQRRPPSTSSRRNKSSSAALRTHHSSDQDGLQIFIDDLQHIPPSPTSAIGGTPRTSTAGGFKGEELRARSPTKMRSPSP
ncbi:major facilitator superfamily domain-containing protein [Fimicolochytrium jonesii]|uniref:major facilitator superfamily domain-containing protein n=1 Tax=Fimicolochytrium jonesii TaxID=1396493 RepID=UPI0022FED80C|nr:major facilitator superfamily domain-containing protein [Fimicolochytrium jonesii]KAI8825040.1 major facilitator superfamily domain-containing protein [Fimicolochytrium jonesii]